MQLFSLLVFFSGCLVLASTKDRGFNSIKLNFFNPGSWDLTIKQILEAKMTFEASQASNLYYPGTEGVFYGLGGFPGRFLRSG